MGSVWDGLGPLLGALGHLLAVFWAFKVELFSSMGPRWAPRGLLDRFWIDLGRDLGRFLEDLGRSGEEFGRVWSKARWCLARALVLIRKGFFLADSGNAGDNLALLHLRKIGFECLALLAPHILEG